MIGLLIVVDVFVHHVGLLDHFLMHRWIHTHLHLIPVVIIKRIHSVSATATAKENLEQ
jgi:hypothetical protein